jgi:hypothetical protein
MVSSRQRAMAQASKKRASTFPPVKQAYLPFKTGLNLLTPGWEVNPGTLRDAKNYEIAIEDGYQDVAGYERFDGNDKPSAQTYAILDVTITGEYSVGDTVTGATSSATAVVLAVDTTTTAPQSYLVVTKISGTFVAAENLQVSAVTEGTVTAVPVTDGASTNELHCSYTNLAADEYRGDISAVPGSGPIRGIWMLSDVVYAFRNNAGDTACDMYKSTSSGWSLVALGRELSFTSGGYNGAAIEEGDTITGATSGATAEITRVVLESGSWEAGDAAGRLIFASQTGTYQSEVLNIGGNDHANIAGDSSAITMGKDGRFEFVTSDFATGSDRMYGVDKINRGFEFDGTVFVPIATGMSNDTPDHVAVHRNHLFYSFNGIIQHSALGYPYQWSPRLGAAALSVSQEITGLNVEPGSEGNATLVIYSRNRIHVLYGTSSLNWNLVPYRREIGASPYTIQQVTTSWFFGTRGISDMYTTQRFGNFVHATHSHIIQTLIDTKRTLAVSSAIVRDKNQYRVFFSDNTAIYVTLGSGGKIKGMMPVEFSDPVRCCVSLEDSNDDEVIYFGSDDGWVYQMDKGTSFDGDNIDAYFVTHFDYQGSLRWLKRYLDVSFEAKGTSYATFSLDWDLGYNTTERSQPPPQTVITDLSDTSDWDGGDTWDAGGFWDGRSLAPAYNKLGGSAENISIRVSKDSDCYSPIRFSGAFINYTLRRRMRNG